MGLDQHTIGSMLTDGTKQVYIVSDNDQRTRASNIAQNAVESGSVITDHVALTSDTGTITGYLLGDGAANQDAQDYLGIIENWQNNGTALKYYGRYYIDPLLISNCDHSFDITQNAVKVTLSWTVLHLVAAPAELATAVKKPADATGNEVYVTVGPGDTYWGWMSQYGTSLEQLRSWNGWADTAIPIAARARVK